MELCSSDGVISFTNREHGSVKLMSSANASGVAPLLECKGHADVKQEDA